MILVSLDTTNILLIGALNAAVGVVCLVGWLLIRRLNLAKTGA